MSAVGVVDLWKTYDGQRSSPTLRGVDLEIQAGEFCAVLGPSGCGKTTLLRAIAGVELADSGTIRVGDRTLDDGRTHVPPEQRRVGLVPQEGALFPHLDVAGNVGFGLRRMHRTERAGRIEEMLELVGLVGLGARRPHELSGGQQQRVAVARALATRPDVVLLDEPFGALDASLRGTVRDQVAELLAASGATAILVTHDQEEAMSFADRIAVMSGGRIVQAGSPVEVYRRPADLATARALGDAIVVTGSRATPGTAEVDTALGRLPLDPEREHAVGAEVAVLIRPEQLVPRPEGDGRVGEVTRVRFQGSTADITLRIDDLTVVARWTSPGVPAVDSKVAVGVVGPVIAYPPE